MTCLVRTCPQCRESDGECELSLLPVTHSDHKEPANCTHRKFKEREMGEKK